MPDTHVHSRAGTVVADPVSVEMSVPPELYHEMSARKSARPFGANTQQPAWKARPTRTSSVVWGPRMPPVADEPFGVTSVVPVDTGSGCTTLVVYAMVPLTAVNPVASVSIRPFGVTVLPGASKTSASPPAMTTNG